MKYLLFILLCLVASSCIDEPLNPQLQSVFLADIFFAGEEKGWAVGTQGTIYHTSDGGKTWVKQNSYVTTDLLAVMFTDENTGWAAGSGGTVLKTVNGGIVWSKAGTGTTRFIKGIHAFNADTAIMVGQGGLIMRTENAGTSWRIDTLLKSGSDYNSVFFADGLRGWAVGKSSETRSYNYISTTDGGHTWDTTRSDGANYFSDIVFTDPDTGFRSSAGGLEKSSDGGNTWAYKWQPESGTQGVIEDVEINGSRFAGAGFKGYNIGLAVISADNGENWTEVFDGGHSVHIYGLKFLNPVKGFAVGGNGFKIYETTDGGLTWKDRSP